MNYLIQYKCRRCGAVFAARGPDIAVTDVEDELVDQDGREVVRFHDCHNGAIGIADVAGARRGEESEPRAAKGE